MSLQLEVLGTLFHDFSKACINLKYIAEDEAHRLLQGTLPDGWYPMEQFKKISDLAENVNVEDEPLPVLERAGEEMMLDWYNKGPGRAIIQKGADFLTFQTGEAGYQRVVKGPEEHVGRFVLEHLDLEAGKAVVVSTSPFDRDLERGVLIGGMKAPGDLTYIEVSNEADPDRFDINFS